MTTDSPSGRILPGIRAVLLDIEGTTTPMAFVYDVLFPFARAHLREFLETSAASPRIAEILDDLRAEHVRDEARHAYPPPWPPDAGTNEDDRAAAVAYLEWLMEQDRKSPALKALQGEIWDRGYRDGRLRGEMFDDVRPALDRWTSSGLRIFIYSSGSVLAQRWLFTTTQTGDLTAFIAGYFDTSVGAKIESSSYGRIVAALDLAPDAVLFISDMTRELDAARTARLQTLLIERPGNVRQPASTHRRITSFDEL